MKTNLPTGPVPLHSLNVYLLLVFAAGGGDGIEGPAAGPLGTIRVTIQTSAATAEAVLDPDGTSCSQATWVLALSGPTGR
jgi:hypothetical protein